jgi:four helix bundle protein
MFNKRVLQERIKRYTIDVFIMLNKLPKSPACNIITSQRLRASSSESANYRAACRAKSKRDCVNKLKIVEEEADESMFWLEILSDLHLGDVNETTYLIAECNELLSIIIASLKTLRNQSYTRNS